MVGLEQQLEALKSLSQQEQMQTLIQIIQENEVPAEDSSAYKKYAQLVVSLLSASKIPPAQRLTFGEKINDWGDPRILSPSHDDYWADIDLSIGRLCVACHLVSIQEWKAFLSDGYDHERNWSKEGLKWKKQPRPTWSELASSEGSLKYVYDNQPVVGVCWFEAEAYANACNARLMSFYEREGMIRGDEKRPYPWGSPFGHSNANTLEEGLEKPCAIGMYSTDSTADGIFDLAGNVAEWMEDEVDSKRVIHPGAWNVDSMAAWVKASSNYSPSARTAYLGFRLVRDVE